MAIIKHEKNKFPLIIRWVIGAPFIWIAIVPILFSDIVLEICHRVFFPIYGIRTVERKKYIRIFDRTKLPYLTWYEKLGCAYCGYVNGWLRYASVVAGRTENYFCAVAHLEDRGYVQAAHEAHFAEYGDEEALKRRYSRTEENEGLHIIN